MTPARLTWLAGVAAAVLIVAQLNPFLSDYGDDAEFLILGQGLAQGKGYAWINSPETPAHNRYPPGYAALLAGALIGSGTRDDAFAAIIPAKLATAATFLASIVLLVPVARRRLPPAWAAAAVAAYALNPFAIRFGVQVMSDLPYVCVLLGTLAWADWNSVRSRSSMALGATIDPGAPASIALGANGGHGVPGSAVGIAGTSRSPAGKWVLGHVVGTSPSGAVTALDTESVLVGRASRRSERGGGGAAMGRFAQEWGRGWLTGHLVPWHWLTLGVLLAAGAIVRSIGLPAAVGVLAWAWWAGGWRRAGLTGAAFVLPTALWWVRDATLSGGWRYLQELKAAQYQAPTEGSVSAGDMLARALGNAAFVAGKPGVFGLAGLVIGALVAAILAVGYFSVMRRVAGAAEWVVVPITLSVLVWPIRTGRYLLPIVPLAGIYAIAGALLVAAWLANRRSSISTSAFSSTARTRNLSHTRWRQLMAIGIALLISLEGLYAAREAAENQQALAQGSTPAAYYRDRPDWSHYLEAAGWLRQHAGLEDVAMARRHFALYVYSGRYVDKYRFDVTEDELAYLLAGTARKFVVEDAFEILRGDFAPLPVTLRARGGDLILRYSTAEPSVRIWELVRPPGTAGR